MKRLFLELDEIREYMSIEDYVEWFNLEGGFWKVIENCLINRVEAWQAIQEADEIYADTAFINQGYGIGGSGGLMNVFMEMAVSQNITGKSVYILREFNSIRWYNLKANLLEEVFREKNTLYIKDPDENTLAKVNLDEAFKKCDFD